MATVPQHAGGKREYRMAVDTIDAHDLAELIEWLETNPRLTQGELVREFEQEWAKWLGTRYAVFCNSGSSANLLMFYALVATGRFPTGKVIAPAISWSTTVAPIVQFGLEPILCDAEPRTFGVDPAKLEALVEEHRPDAVAVVHVLGVPCEIGPIVDLQRRFGFTLIEDACAATGSRYDGTLVGNFGEMASFSFFYGHHISTVEGGMVCTNDQELYTALLELRSHGWAKDLPADWEAEQAAANGISGFNRPFTFYHPGFNLRATEINARFGLSQMYKLPDVLRRRVVNHLIYSQTLDGRRGLTLQQNERAEICSIACAVLAESPQHRERIAGHLAKHRIDTRPVGGGNMSRQPFWKQRYGAQDLPVADDVAARAFQLPNHPAHSIDDIKEISRVVLEA